MKSHLLTMKAFIILVIICLYIKPILAQDLPLFQRDEPLELFLEADVIALTEDKSEEPEYTPALLIQKLPDYKINGFEIKVKPRGNTRRLTDLCDFPPLKFNFKKNQLNNTVFEGQDKLKFVSQCRQLDEFKNYVLEEYLLYKTYHIVTEESYKVRLVNITIKDKKLRIPAFQMSGFLIEDDKSLAKRIGAKSFEELIYSQDTCTEASVDRFAMFQYMIGNTDWYINTKHNTDIFKYKRDGSFIPVPFDFDCAGVINTFYAKPSIEIPITQVRQRYFKGSCRDFNAFNATFRLFNEKQDEIYTLYNTFEYLPKNVIKKSLKYYNKFYNIINNSELVDASFYSVCKPGPLNIRLIN
ncbi:MAG: hypothetical protein KAI99_17580 [Cyclobacteriaceae bacterium]|nr:hypothetical protein [Cyclobacteriaceae bacterium]